MAMVDLSFLQEELQVLVGQLLSAIQRGEDGYDAAGWARVQQLANACARALKGEALVPKTLLNELHVAAKILRAEANRGKNCEAFIKAASMLEWIFDLILLDECADDRVPGVPRII